MMAIKCQEPFGAQAVGNSLHGLQGMSSDNAEVRSLVQALSGQVERCREPLSAQHVGNALYGLQGMSSDDAEVRSLIRALSGQVERMAC
jgi:ribonuclease HI